MQQSTRTEMRPVKYHYADTFWCTYIVSVFAASIAETGENYCYLELFLTIINCNPFLVTYPLDLTKTRLQIQGEALSSKGIPQVISKSHLPVLIRIDYPYITLSQIPLTQVITHHLF